MKKIHDYDDFKSLSNAEQKKMTTKKEQQNKKKTLWNAQQLQ